MLRRTPAAVAAVSAMVCALAGLAPTQTRAGRVVEWKMRDAHVLLTPVRAPREVLLVTVDAAATEAFQEPLLFWHARYADAIDRLAGAGARVIALDIVFAVPVEAYAPGLDARLAAAVARAEPGTPVLLGTAPLARQKEQERAVPVNILAASLGRLTDVTLTPDEDDFVRRFAPVNREGVPSLALAAAQTYLGRPVRTTPGEEVEIRHAGPAGTVERISLRDLLSAPAEEVAVRARGRIVLIGADLPFDRHATPWYAFRPGQPANTAGVEVHASAAATLLAGWFRREAPWGMRFAAQMAFAFAGFWLTRRQRGRALVALLGLLTVVTLAGGHAAFRAGWWFSQTGLLVAMAGGAVMGLAAGRWLLREAVRRYAAPAVAEAVASSGSLHPPARRIEATVLFADIRGFSAWCETRTPSEVAAGLNAHFDSLAAIIQRHGGEVNKFSGDAILALFLEGDHARRAIEAVREALAAVLPFPVSAGIHTGELVLGVIGGGGKLEYTALGDAVNVAARLEALNRETATRVLISETTATAAGLTGRPVGCFLVKGRRAAVEACTLKEG